MNVHLYQDGQLILPSFAYAKLFNCDSYLLF